MRTPDAIEAARARGCRSLDEAEGKRLLASFGVRVPRFVTVTDGGAVTAALEGLHGPFAV